MTTSAIIAYLEKKNYSKSLFHDLILLNYEKLHYLSASLTDEEKDLFPFLFPSSPNLIYKSLYIELLLTVNQRNGFLSRRDSDVSRCQICSELYEGTREMLLLIPCRHLLCGFCAKRIGQNNTSICPFCRAPFRLILPSKCD
jgi:predicted Zn-ribbon and HTH transcriptional regulator